MKKNLMFVIIFLIIIIPTSLNAQGGGTWQYNGTDCNSWRTLYGIGKVGINKDPVLGIYDPTDPTLLVHGFYCTVPTPAQFHTPIIRLQSGSEDRQPPGLFGQSEIEFWSNWYGSPLQWMVGKIQSINGAPDYTVLDGGTDDFKGGLAFYCSGFPSLANAQGPPPMGPQEVFRIATGRMGIGLSDLMMPSATLEILGPSNGPAAEYNLFSIRHKIVGQDPEDILVVRSTGQVKIGDLAIPGDGLTPLHSDFKLAVDGKIVVKEAVITLSDWDNWPDNVFDENYKLPDLTDLELKIKHQKHLPGVPNAEYINKNGLSLGSFQATLLEKIEQLTLYVIDLKKENELMKQKIESIETKSGKK